MKIKISCAACKQKYKFEVEQAGRFEVTCPLCNAALNFEVATLLPDNSAPVEIISDVANTSFFASPENHQPLVNYFRKRNIKCSCKGNNVDTTGFFDEAACLIGDHYQIIEPLLKQIKFAYRQNFSSITIPLQKYSDSEQQQLRTIFADLHDKTFLQKVFFDREKNGLRLNIADTPAIGQFFNGGWLEWYGLMCCLAQLENRTFPADFSIGRGIEIVLPDDSRYELDIVFLLNGHLTVIECKSGEFRDAISRHQQLQKNLGIDKANYLLCATEFTPEKANALTAMYPLTFLPLSSLKSTVAAIMTRAASGPRKIELIKR